MESKKNFHSELKQLMDEYVNRVYDCSTNFPKEELYGLTSQLRRAALSVILNYVEGYARQRKAVLKNFLEIAYGSLKESSYLVTFANKRRYTSDKNREELEKLSQRMGAMLWGIISKLKQ